MSFEISNSTYSPLSLTEALRLEAEKRARETNTEARIYTSGFSTDSPSLKRVQTGPKEDNRLAGDL